MKVCAISDMHGNLDFNIDNSDILLICGDITPLKIQDKNEKSVEWFINTFIPWCDKQPVDKIFFVGGNHDKWIYEHPEDVIQLTTDTKITYLLDTLAVYQNKEGQTLNIYGTPWCHQFFNWSFMDYDDKELLEKKFSLIPENVDILITHDPPYGYNDQILEHTFWNDYGKHVGNKALITAILDKKPRYVFSGHIHSGSKEPTILDNGTEICNVSLLGEDYNLKYKPRYVEIS